MPTTNISVRHRPVRIGFLVRPGELGDLQKAAGLCTLLWGGIRNPIIPVQSETDTQAEDLLNRFQVDIVYPVENFDAITRFVERYSYLRAPRLYSRGLFHENWRTKKNKVTFLDARNIVDIYWYDHFKDKPADFTGNCTLVTWNAADDLNVLFAMLFGFYPTQYNLQEDFGAAFLKGLRSKLVHIDPADAVPGDLVKTITPLALTGVDLRGYGGFHRDANGLYVGDPTDFMDLVYFWNLRAAGNVIEFAPGAQLERFDDSIRVHLKRLDDIPHGHPNIEDDITLSFRDDYDDAARAIAHHFETKKGKILSRCSDAIWNGLNVEPVMFHFDREQALALIDNEQGRYGVTISLPPKKFLADSERQIDDQYLAVSLEPIGDFGYSGHTLAPPFRRELNEFYSRNIGIDPWAIRSEPQGLGVLITARDQSVHLRPIPHRAVIEALLGQADINVEPSQAGRLTDRLIEKLDGLEGARVFKIRGVRNLINGLGAQAAIERGSAIASIWNEGQFKKHEDLYIEPRDPTSKLTTNGVFDFLLKRDFFRAGLKLVCDHCRLDSWLSLSMIDDEWRCEYCGHHNVTSLHLRSRGDWHFRKSGLFARDNNQEGALPVILALLALQRIVDMRDLMYITSLNIKGANACEVDFMAVHRERDRRRKIEWALGEAKSAGGRIEVTDVENMKRLQVKLRDVGIEAYLVFAKTADAFLEEELKLFRDLAREGSPPVLLTNREIEPYHPYYEDDKADELPEKYAQRFEDMARNSEHRYLGRVQRHGAESA